MVVKNDDLVVGTNGRSLWILDEITPLRSWSPKLEDADVHLMPPTPAHRFRQHSVFSAQAAGENPPAGAVFHYILKKKPKDPVKLEILDADGKLVGSLSSLPEPEEPETPGDYEVEKEKKKPLPTEPGLHRVVWNLQHRGAGKIPKAKADYGDPKVGPMARPGLYTAKLTVDGKTESQRLEIRPDPRTSLTAGEHAEQEQFILGVRDEITKLSTLVIQLRHVRQQVEDRGEAFRGDPAFKPLLLDGQELVDKLTSLEEKLHNPRAQIAYDILAQKGGAKLYSRLILLYVSVLDSDGVPTQGMREVFMDQSAELKKLEEAWNKLLAEDVTKLNQKAAELKAPHVAVPKK